MTTKEAIEILTTKHFEALGEIQKALQTNHDVAVTYHAFIQERDLMDDYDKWVKEKNKKH